MSEENTNEIPYYRINDMDEADRPRERLLKNGPEALSNYELLAILLRTGRQGESVIDLAKRILSENGGLDGLRRITLPEFEKVKGIGGAKAAQIMAAIELGRRFALTDNGNEKIKIGSSEDVYNYVRYEMEAFDHEELWVLNLDTRHCVMAVDKLYRGSLNTSTVRIAEVFKNPVKRNTCAIILVHNHPSGEPKPSAADILTTKNVMEAGKILEINVLDHIVIGKGQFLSINNYLK